MTVFNYFIPDRRAVKLADLVELGLGYVFEPETADTPRGTVVARPVIGGPGGKNGVICSTSDRQVGYFENDQVWQEESGGAYWVGYWKDDRPTPETLARSNQVAGATLQLDDGHAWLIPKARHFDEFEDQLIIVPTLPTRLTRDELGNWVPGEIKQRYWRLWDLANHFIQAVVDDAEEFVQFDDLVVEAFQANYRVSAIEIDLLGIYDVNVRDRVVRIITDLDGWAELIKKKRIRLDSGSSHDGQNESKPDETTEVTDQQ